MSDLNLASQKVKAARQTAGRTIENRFLDLCKAVERVIVHLQRQERERKAKS
jgi:hypothetical protein